MRYCFFEGTASSHLLHLVHLQITLDTPHVVHDETDVNDINDDAPCMTDAVLSLRLCSADNATRSCAVGGPMGPRGRTQHIRRVEQRLFQQHVCHTMPMCIQRRLRVCVVQICPARSNFPPEPPCLANQTSQILFFTNANRSVRRVAP